MRVSRKKKVCHSTFATFEKPPRKRNFKFLNKIFFWGGFFILVIGGFIYLLIFSPVFKVKIIEISGNKETESGDIEKIAKNFLSAKIFKFLPRDSLFFLPSDILKKEIQQKAAVIATVGVKKVFPDKLALAVVERKEAAVWCQSEVEEGAKIDFIDDDKAATSSIATSFEAQNAKMIKNHLPKAAGCFFIDETGAAFREAPEIFGSFIPTFYGEPGVAYGPGEQVVASSTVAFAVEAKKEFRRNGVGLSGFLLNKKTAADAELSALADDGWLIYLNTARPAASQAQTVGVLLSGELKNKIKTLEYIDLRIDNRVYYK